MYGWFRWRQGSPCILIEAGLRLCFVCVEAYVFCRTQLNAVVKTLEGSDPFYSFKSVDGLYVATGFVIVPLAAEFDEFTLLEGTGCASTTKDGA